MEQTNAYPVKLHIYDLSRGMARQLSPALLGKISAFTCCSALRVIIMKYNWTGLVIQLISLFVFSFQACSLMAYGRSNSLFVVL